MFETTKQFIIHSKYALYPQALLRPVRCSNVFCSRSPPDGATIVTSYNILTHRWCQSLLAKLVVISPISTAYGI